MTKTQAVVSLVACLVLLSAVVAADDAPSAKSNGFHGQLGLQLYSLRAQFAKDVPGTLDKVRDMGFKYVETAGTYGMPPAKFRKEAESRGLTIVSGHFPYDRFRDDPEGIAKEAEALGVKYAGCAWIAHSGPFSEKGCREAAKVFNKAGEVLAKHDIKFFYHTHGYEFQPYGSGNLF